MMDEVGVDMQILSLAPEHHPGVEPGRSVTFRRTTNDRLAEIVATHPQRFGAFASLPMSAPEHAADELERAVRDLGHVGAMIHGQTGGTFLDDPSVRPVLAAAERLSVPIYLHPAPPPKVVADAYFSASRPTGRSRSRPPDGAGMPSAVRPPADGPGGVFERFPAPGHRRWPRGENLRFAAPGRR